MKASPGRLREHPQRDRPQRTGNPCNMLAGRDKWWHEVTANQPEICEPEWVAAEHPLFILYTSGSTGKPKGVQHSSGGYLLQAILTMKWTFDNKPSDVFWCTADIGWVTGHTYITYGPLAAAPPRSSSRACRPIPTPVASGRPFRITGSMSSMPRRRRSAR